MVSVYAISFMFMVLVAAEFIYAKSVNALSPANQVTFTNGVVAIPLAQVSDGDLHRYAAHDGGIEIRFLLYQKPDGKVVAIFDACEICGSGGFFAGWNGRACKAGGSPANV